MNWNIELYASENGDEPVMQFLNSLSEKHRAKAIWEIDLLEEHGLFLKMPYVKNIQGENIKVYWSCEYSREVIFRVYFIFF